MPIIITYSQTWQLQFLVNTIKDVSLGDMHAVTAASGYLKQLGEQQ